MPRSPFNDRCYLWIVWRQAKKAGEVAEVLGMYADRGDALFEAQRADADGMTPVKDKVLANVMTCALPALLERNLRGLTAAAK